MYSTPVPFGVVQGLAAAFGFINRIGIDRIARWDAMLTTRLRDGLARIKTVHMSSSPDPRFASAITMFAVIGTTGRELQDALWTKKIRVRAQGGDRGVRLSAHLYVSPADIDRAQPRCPDVPMILGVLCEVTSCVRRCRRRTVHIRPTAAFPLKPTLP